MAISFPVLTFIRSLVLQGTISKTAAGRANRTSGEEFYEVQDLDLRGEGLNHQLERYACEYNYIRPHQALGYLTAYELFCRKKHDQRQ